MPNNDNEINVLSAKRRDIRVNKKRETCDKKRRKKKWQREKERKEISVPTWSMRKDW